MRYRNSAALVRFRAAVEDARRVVGRAQTTKVGGKHVRSAAYVKCAAMVLTGAAFETYIEDLVDWVVARLNSEGRVVSALPPAMRAQVFNHGTLKRAYGAFLVDQDEEGFMKSISKFWDRPEASLALSTAAVPQLTPGAIIGNKDFPSPKNVRAVFRRMGLDGVFAKLSSEMGKNAELELRSFLDVRNALSHTGDLAMVTGSDIVQYLDRLHLLGCALDKVAFRHARDGLRLTDWR